MADISIPRVQAAVATPGGMPTTEWYTFFLRLRDAVGSDSGIQAQIDALEAQVAALEGGGGAGSATFLLQGIASVLTDGTPAGGVVQISLDGDQDAPGNTYCYGTGPDGLRGWYRIADAIAVTPDLSGSLDPVTNVLTLGLADLADAGVGGALVKIVRDAKGRISATSAATTSDLPEGSRLYFTDPRADARADARIAAQKGQPNGLASLGADLKIPSAQLPALAITETYVVASEAAQLALSAQEGDVAVRTDIDTNYIRNAGATGTMADWTELLTPAAPVQSVNGMTGNVTVTAASIGALQAGDNVSDLVNDAGYVERTADNLFTGANQFDKGIGIGVAPNEIDGVFVNMVVNADAGDPTGIYTSMIAGSAGVLPVSRNLYGTYGGATSAITYANSGGAGTPVFPVTTGLRAEGYSANTAATDWSYITNGVDALAVNRSAAAAVGSVTGLKGDASDTAGAIGGLSMAGISGSINQVSTTAVYNNLFGIDCSVASAGPVVDSYALRVVCYANPNQTGTRYGVSIVGVERNYFQGYTLFDDFTSSTSPSTGAIVTSGGLGVGGNVNVGFNIIAGGEIRSGNYIIPNAHNAYSLGLSFLAWTEVFAQNPVISPSDARLKSAVREPAPTEIAAFATIARLPSVWQWLHRIDSEGDAARLHSGPTVQAAMAVMEAHGLDWKRYSCFCYDRWEDQYDQGGALLAAAGDRYSFRREELLWWVMRAQFAQLDTLEGRVAALEAARTV
ncbi:tail fiber domain-containing protein [Xanthomonas sp. WHRI 7945]|nr:tail fiber domain-containing protein [Xanthomonas campestris pv. campestris]